MKAYVLSDRHTDKVVCNACGAGKRVERGPYSYDDSDPGVSCARIVVAAETEPGSAIGAVQMVEVNLCVDCAKALVTATGGDA